MLADQCRLSGLVSGLHGRTMRNGIGLSSVKGKEMDIRDATITDCQAITDLLNRAFADEREYYDATPLKEIEESMRHGDAWLVGVQEDQVIACVCVYGQRLDGNFGRIGQLAVEPSCWGRGYGPQLMQAAEQRLQRDGSPGVKIGVLNFKQAKLLPFYRRLGYVDTGVRAAPEPPARKPCQMILMSKRLDR